MSLMSVQTIVVYNSLKVVYIIMPSHSISIAYCNIYDMSFHICACCMILTWHDPLIPALDLVLFCLIFMLLGYLQG